jgi:hypothetical protein
VRPAACLVCSSALQKKALLCSETFVNLPLYLPVSTGQLLGFLFDPEDGGISLPRNFYEHTHTPLLAAYFLLVSYLVFSSTLKMEAVFWF